MLMNLIDRYLSFYREISFVGWALPTSYISVITTPIDRNDSSDDKPQISSERATIVITPKFISDRETKYSKLCRNNMSNNNRMYELQEFSKTNPSPAAVYEEFYDENVVVQENLQPPRVGRALSIKRQQLMNANIKEVHNLKIGAVLRYPTSRRSRVSVSYLLGL
jgi:hypothetical protein